MPDLSGLRAVKPYLALGALVVVAVLLAAAIYEQIDLQWIMVLWCALVAAIAAVGSGLLHMQKEVARDAALALSGKESLAKETRLRLLAEKSFAINKIRLQFVDDRFPGILACFDREGRCIYHNQAFRQWSGLASEQIEGKTLEEITGKEFYDEIQSSVDAVMTGNPVSAIHVRKPAAGFAAGHVSAHYMPDPGIERQAAGFYLLYMLVAPADVPVKRSVNPLPAEKVEVDVANPGGIAVPEFVRSVIDESFFAGSAPEAESREIELFDSSMDEQVSGWGISAARITQAIEEDEFRLYCQVIVPARSDQGAGVNYEILVRLAEEEDNLMPPGAFLPFVEKYDMMPRLDRWVVSHLLEWVAAKQPARTSMFCINVAKDTLSDTGFPTFIKEQLDATGVRPETLCFEIEESDAILRRADTARFSSQVSQYGCYVTLCSFGNDRTSFDLLKSIKISFLKIDGSLICNMLQDPVDLAKVTSINRVAHAIGIQTIAEMVETEEVITRLREIGIDFLQGFGIGRPRVIQELEKSTVTDLESRRQQRVRGV